MGLITAALGGMGEGLEKGTNLAGGLYLKGSIEAEHQRLAQEAQDQREERNLRLAATLKREENDAQGRLVPANTTLVRKGQPDYTAPNKLTQEELDAKQAEANLRNAQAAWYNRDRPGSNKEPKPTMPKLMVTEKDDSGNPTQWVDQNTGAIGNKLAGSPAVPPVSHWFKPDDPAKAAVPSGIQWTDAAGQQIPGLHVYYPDMVNRGVSTGNAPAAAPAMPDPLGLRAALSQPAAAPAAPATTTPPLLQPQKPAPLTVERFLSRQRGGFLFQAPPRSSIYAQKLNGRIFTSPQEAQAEYDALMNQGG